MCPFLIWLECNIMVYADPLQSLCVDSVNLHAFQVINATKEALAEAGIHVPSLEAAAAAAGRGSASKGVPRSATTLLVKNLPYSAEEGELAELFGRSGTVVRLVLPPTKVVALVEFGEAQDARWVGGWAEWLPANEVSPLCK
jgi:hypothetical protein